MLEDGTVACRERWCGEAKELPERVVPRHDRQDNAEWIADNRVLRCVGRNRFVSQLARGVLGVEVAIPGALLNFRHGFSKQLNLRVLRERCSRHLVTQLATRIVEYMQAEELRQAERLAEHKLAELFRVSRSPIRSALRLLQAGEGAA